VQTERKNENGTSASRGRPGGRMGMGIGGGNFLPLTRHEASFQDLSLIRPFSTSTSYRSHPLTSPPHPQALRSCERCAHAGADILYDRGLVSKIITSALSATSRRGGTSPLAEGEGEGEPDPHRAGDVVIASTREPRNLVTGRIFHETRWSRESRILRVHPFRSRDRYLFIRRG